MVVGGVAQEAKLLSIAPAPFADREMNPQADALEHAQFTIERPRLKTAGLPAIGQNRSHRPGKGLWQVGEPIHLLPGRRTHSFRRKFTLATARNAMSSSTSSARIEIPCQALPFIRSATVA